MMPSSDLLMMASSDDSTIDANRRLVSPRIMPRSEVLLFTESIPCGAAEPPTWPYRDEGSIPTVDPLTQMAILQAAVAMPTRVRSDPCPGP